MRLNEGDFGRRRGCDGVAQPVSLGAAGRCHAVLKQWVRGALGAAALALASGLHAADLFLPVGPAGGAADRWTVAPAARSAPAGRSKPAVPHVLEQRVRIARHELTMARNDVENAGAGRLQLNVRDGVRLDVVVERTAPIERGYTLSGRVSGGSAGFVTLVVHEEAVAGAIWTPDSEYELNPLGGGIHALRDLTNAPPIECAGALPSGLSAADATVQGGTDDGSVVDILVVWTPKVEEALRGGEPEVLSRIDLLIAYTNDAFERSGAFVSLNLVGAEKVDYLETDSSGGTSLNRLRDPDDGHMDSVHDRRNALGADLVFLLLSSRGSGLASGAFSVGFANTITFAHEVGHNFGILHERYQFPSIGSWRRQTYEHGFTYTLKIGCKHTIMSYGAECAGAEWHYAVPFYASPWRYVPHDGRALGVTRFSKERGARGPADAVLALNRNRHYVANFRPSRNEE